MHINAVTPASGAAPAALTLTRSGLRATNRSSGTTISSDQLPSCTAGLTCGRKPYTSSPGA